MILDLFRRQAAGLVPKTFNLQSAIFNLQSSLSTLSRENQSIVVKRCSRGPT
ncbi:MAG: hypothetical protein RMY28_021810 [Nostoc sp. ChiSLP01]|nr:hypothetical protein [Nostoc sp. CmiSLP01]MDZ8284472.1 hypothetical protein [Nostoc sp. ChiSLP01]